MKTKFKLLALLVASALLTFPKIVRSNELVISLTHGEVEILKKGSANWLKSSEKQILASGDKIRTGKKSKATLISEEGHRILIKQKTVFEITQAGPLNWEFNEETGRVRLKVEKLNAGQSLKVKTPTAVCSVRGTEFEVAYENNQSICDVYDGHVGFTDAQQTSPEISILENQRSVIEQGAPPRPPEIIPEGERTRDPELSDRSLKGPSQFSGGGSPQMGSKEGRPFAAGGESKEETKGRMEKEFQRHMSEFKGSPEEKARFEKEFKDHMERSDKEGKRFGDSEGKQYGNAEGRRFGDMELKQYGSQEGKPLAENKEESMSRMKEEYQKFMDRFEGSADDKAKYEKEFKDHMERFEKEGMGREGEPRGEYKEEGRSEDRTVYKEYSGDYSRGEFREYRGYEAKEGEFRETNFRREDDEFRREIVNEVNNDMERDYYQETVKDELRIELVQTSRELIDRNGKRVRLEENVTRPTEDSFKFIALSKRDNRQDSVVFEVVANKALPTKLEDAGNLWFNFGSNKPDWYAIKQRLTITNGQDTISQLFLDGDSKEVGFTSVFFNETGEVFSSSKRFETIFDHRYEFINGNAGALDKMWVDSSFRPGNNGDLSGVSVSGMMWHMRPILIEKYEPIFGNTVASFWKYSFVTTNGSGNSAVGKLVVTQYRPGSTINMAHIVQTSNYINFTDSNGNGRLDSGETYEDLNRDGKRDINEPFEDVAQLGFDGTKDTSRAFNGTGDGSFFSDLNRDGSNNDGVSGADAFSVAQNPWASLKEETLMINDQGQIVDFATIGLGSLAANTQDTASLADLFEKLNMERVFTSSEFGGRDIDVIMTPRTFMKAKMIELKMDGNEPIDRR